jgi:hypothetical protein
MSDLSEYLEKHESSKKYGHALKSAEKIVGIASGVYGYYQTAKDIGGALGLWGGEPDGFELLGKAIEELRIAIEAAHADLLAATRGEGKLEMKRDIAAISAQATTAVNTIRSHWNEPELMDKPAILKDTLYALEVLSYDAYWERTFY